MCGRVAVFMADDVVRPACTARAAGHHALELPGFAPIQKLYTLVPLGERARIGEAAVMMLT